MMYVIMSHSEGFSPVLQRTRLGGVKHPVKTKAKVLKAALKRSVAVYRAKRVLTLALFSHLRALFGSNSFYTLDDTKLLEWSAVKLL